MDDRDNTLLYFNPSEDSAQIVVDGVLTLALYNQLTSRDSTDSYRVGVFLASLAASNYAYNYALRDVVQAATHPGDAMLQALQDDWRGDPSVVGNLALAGGGYLGFKGVQGARKGYASWKARAQGDPEVPAPEPLAETTPELLEGAEGASGATESAGFLAEAGEVLGSLGEAAEFLPLMFL